MSLNWQWNDKMGEVVFNDDQYHPDHPYRTSIYQGNALMIWCNEFPDETYSLCNFFVDNEHLKNMLGLNAKKGYGTENLLNDQRIKTIRLNTRYKSVPKIVELIAKAHTNVAIELYYEEEGK